MHDAAPHRPFQIVNGDCLEVMRSMEDDSIDAIITDPPYFRVKNLPWDRQWSDADAFIEWIGELAAEWFRILRPNGSLYCFASPKMAARVELAIGERFNVLNRIVWAKPDPWSEINAGASNAGRIHKEGQRMFYPNSEWVIFAEHYNSDNIAKGQAGYLKKRDELRGFLFEPLRAYLDGERQRAGVTKSEVNGLFSGPNVGQYWWQQRNFQLPTKSNYEILRRGLSSLNHGGEYLTREYEELREQYEELREQYEELRRPFNLTKDDPNTDVWTFKTVSSYPGKHPCEKPLDMMTHIVKTSTRKGAKVLDCFAGSGVTGEACIRMGREFIGIEKDSEWAAKATARLKGATMQPVLI